MSEKQKIRQVEVESGLITIMGLGVIPCHHFGEWLYGSPKDFPNGATDNLPHIVSAAGLVRAGFTTPGTVLAEDALIDIKGELYQLVENDCFDYGDHFGTYKTGVTAWRLVKYLQRSQDSNQSSDASGKQSGQSSQGGETTKQ